MLISRQVSLCRQLQARHHKVYIHEPRRGTHRSLWPCAAGKQDPATAADSQQVTISQALTVIGLSGTLAVGGAAFCGIDVFGLFRWRWQDIQLSLELYSLLLLLDAVLLVPNFSVPSTFLEQPAHTSSVNPQQQQRQQQHKDQKQPQQQQQQQQQPYLDMSAVSASSAWSIDSWRLMLALLKAGLSKPQLQQLPLQVSTALLVAREASSELLLRGFLLTALSGWLADRLYEADAGGLEGLISFPTLGLVGTVPDVALWSATVLATVLFAPAAFQTAEETAGGVGGAMLLRTEAGSAMAAATAATAAGSSKGRGAGSTIASSTSPSSSSSSSSSSSGLKQQAGSSSDNPSIGPSHLSAAVGSEQNTKDGEGEGSDEESLDPEILEYRVVKVSEACANSAATQLAYRITLARALWRVVLGNAVYVVTRQNLAASFVGNVLLSLLQYVCARGVTQSQQPVRSK